MKATPPTLKHIFVLVILTAPLLNLGTCAQLAVESVLDGAFTGVNAALIDEVKDRLGLTTMSG